MWPPPAANIQPFNLKSLLLQGSSIHAPTVDATPEKLILFSQRCSDIPRSSSIRRAPQNECSKSSAQKITISTCVPLYVPTKPVLINLQVFLLQLLIVIVFLLSEVLLPSRSSLLAIPYKLVLQRLLPDIYTPETEVVLHPYFASGLLFVSVTTLVLFFASGMYSEKIGYANK